MMLTHFFPSFDPGLKETQIGSGFFPSTISIAMMLRNAVVTGFASPWNLRLRDRGLSERILVDTFNTSGRAVRVLPELDVIAIEEQRENRDTLAVHLTGERVEQIADLQVLDVVLARLLQLWCHALSDSEARDDEIALINIF